MNWTLIVFAVLTAYFVVRHLREQRARDRCVARCRGCETPLPPGSTTCPDCGIPTQVFEVVSAERATGEARDEGAAQHAIVRSDVCVGCGACVPPCPIPGAIRMEGKLAVVDLNLCGGVGKCAEACPVGAIHVGSGSTQRIEVPDVGPDFQSNVPGVYVVGELGGRGLIKNAVNEGKVAARAVVASLKTSESSDPNLYDVAIVGSGPAGLSAALECLRAGVRYVVLEQGELADTINKYPRHKLLLAEPLSIPLYGDLWVADASKENLLAAWKAIVEKTGLEIHTKHRVESMSGSLGTGFSLGTSEGVFHARRVILALGRRGTPRKLGVEGEDLPKVFYDIVEMEAFAGSRVVVVGGGDSALESAVGLANQAKTEVILSYRGADFARAKERNVKKLLAAESEGRLQVWRESQVRAVREGEIDIEWGGALHTLKNDYLVIRIGGEAPYAFLEKIGVEIVRKEVRLVGAGDDA